MTKIINLFDNKEEKKVKPIKFIKYVNETTGETQTSGALPKDWGNISLLCKNEGGFDMMFAWDDDHTNSGVVYLGHWNDGFVER